jgi:hypothetical protein
MSKLLGEQKTMVSYCKSILSSLNSVVITFDETGRVTTIDNPQLLNLEELLSTMKLTSFEHWLGRSNTQLANDISQALMLGKKVSVTSYDFAIQGKPAVQIKYTVKRLQSDSTKNVFLDKDVRGRRFSQRVPTSTRASINLEQLQQQASGLPLSCLLVMEVVHPNHRMIDQLSCQLPQEIVSLVETTPHKTDGEFLDVAVLVIDIRRCISN